MPLCNKIEWRYLCFPSQAGRVKNVHVHTPTYKLTHILNPKPQQSLSTSHWIKKSAKITLEINNQSPPAKNPNKHKKVFFQIGNYNKMEKLPLCCLPTVSICQMHIYIYILYIDWRNYIFWNYKQFFQMTQ